MSVFEYKVIPAPHSGKRAKGVKGANGRFANALSETINDLASAGWEYVRAESLPSVERKGVMRKRHESYQNVLVFRRLTDAEPTAQSDTDDDGFNPFKRFNTKKEPVITEKAKNDDDIIAEVKSEMDADDVTDALRDRPSKPAD